MTGLCQLTRNVQASGKSAWILTLAVLLGCSKSMSLCVLYFFWIAASLAPLFSTTPVFPYFNSLLRTLNKLTFLHGHAVLQASSLKSFNRHILGVIYTHLFS